MILSAYAITNQHFSNATSISNIFIRKYSEQQMGHPMPLSCFPAPYLPHSLSIPFILTHNLLVSKYIPCLSHLANKLQLHSYAKCPVIKACSLSHVLP